MNQATINVTDLDSLLLVDADGKPVGQVLVQTRPRTFFDGTQVRVFSFIGRPVETPVEGSEWQTVTTEFAASGSVRVETL